MFFIPMEMLVLLLVLLFPISGFAISTVYLQSDTGRDCPPNIKCLSLTNIIQNESYFVSNTELVFLEGDHQLNQDELVTFKGFHILILRGVGQWVTGPEETVMQSSVVINCTKGRGGFMFYNSTSVTIQGLTLNNCGVTPCCSTYYPSFRSAITFEHIKHLNIFQLSVQNSFGFGIRIINCDNVMIQKSSFAYNNHLNTPIAQKSSQNQCKMNYGGNAEVYYIGFMIGALVIVENSNFTKGCTNNYFYGAGLYNHFDTSSVNVEMKSLIFSQNKCHFNSMTDIDLQLCTSILVSSTNSKLSYNVSHLSITSTDSQAGFKINIIQESQHMKPNTKSNITIQHMIMENGFLSIYSAAGSSTSEYAITVSDSKFTRTLPSNINYCIQIQKTDLIYDQFTLYNTTFDTNTANKGIWIIGTSNNLRWAKGNFKMEDCTFVNSSYGTALLLAENAPGLLIINCSFFNNTGGDSVIRIKMSQNLVESTNFEPILILQNSTIAHNDMSGITAVKAVIALLGNNVIHNNKHTIGAGIRLEQASILVIGGTLHLTNNYAYHKGGAIYGSQQDVSYGKYITFTNGESLACSILRYETIYWEYINYRIVFSGNKALDGGSDIYGLILFSCKVPYFGSFSGDRISNIGFPNETSWYFNATVRNKFQFNNSDPLSSMTTKPIMVCFCNNSRPDCSYHATQLTEAYPGEVVPITIATVGYYGGTSPGTVRIDVTNATLLGPIGPQATTVNCLTLNFTLRKTQSSRAQIEIGIYKGILGWDVTVNINFLECPFGFPLDNSSTQCQCSSRLVTHNVTCDIRSQGFSRTGNHWFGNVSDCIIAYTNCPFDYCNSSLVTFHLAEFGNDPQCNGNRTGILCGQCSPGLSLMLGSNNCAHCSNRYLLMLVVFALAGVVLVVVLLVLNLTVSVGTINGLLFYANMVKLSDSYFFPQGNIPVVSQFISWLNLDLGIEMCFFEELDGYWKTWLQFVFPTYLFLIVGAIIVGSQYSVWVCRLCGSNSVPALATLFLMSYTKILRTVTNALSLALLQDCNGGSIAAWSVDGSTVYANGKHLPLLIFSSLVLLVGVAYPLMLIFSPLLEKYSDVCFSHKWNPVAKAKPLLDAYGGPYKDNYRSWTGVTLMVRLVMTLIFSFTSGNYFILNPFIINTIVTGIICLWFSIGGVYKKKLLNLLDTFFLLNLALLCIVSSAVISYSTSYIELATIVSTSLSFIGFFIICILHFKWNFDLKRLKRKFGIKVDYNSATAVDHDDQIENAQERPVSPPSLVYGTRRGENQFDLHCTRNPDDKEPSFVLMDREPLIFDD